LTSIIGKAWLPALAILAVFAMFAIGGQTRSAEADVVDASIVEDVDETCGDQDVTFDTELGVGGAGGGGVVYTSETGEIVTICAVFEAELEEELTEANFQATAGTFVNSVDCGFDDEAVDDYLECAAYTGLNSADVNIQAESFEEGENAAAVHFQCPTRSAFVTITITQETDEGSPISTAQGIIRCYGEPDTVTVTASPTTVEVVPAAGNSAHSEIRIVASSNGLPVNPADTEIDISVPKCAIEIEIDSTDGDAVDPSPLTDSTFDSATATSDDEDASNATMSATATTWDDIFFHADVNNCTPGPVVVTVSVEVEDAADIVRTVTITVVGPPAFITATAAPDRLICGEKSTITVTVKDALQQNVSDNTRVELISNWGSVIAGTGATLGFPGTGPVNPLASSAAATYNGVAIAYLLTSNNHVGAYEVVAAAGGTIDFTTAANDPFFNTLEDEDDDRRSFFDSLRHHSDHVARAPITTQVTVTCSLPAAPVAPTVTAPVTGTGSITPPNTGDAGLASSSSNAMLFVIVGAAAFVLAGIASVSYARR
jgi:hypothetical protein